MSVFIKQNIIRKIQVLPILNEVEQYSHRKQPR